MKVLYFKPLGEYDGTRFAEVYISSFFGLVKRKSIVFINREPSIWRFLDSGKFTPDAKAIKDAEQAYRAKKAYKEV